MLYVADYTDNRFPVHGGFGCPSDARADRVLAREKFPGESFVDDHNNRSVRAILAGKFASAKKRNTHERKVIAEYRPSLNFWCIGWIHRPPLDDEIVAERIAAHRQLADHGGSDAGK